VSAAPRFTARPNRKQLPAGLDPVTAGRWGLWLMGQREHRRALRRSLWHRVYLRRSLADRALALITPWPVYQYPGRIQALSELLGVSQRMAKHYVVGHNRLTLPRRERLLSYLEADLAERLEVIRLLKMPDERDEEVARGRRQSLAKAQAESRKRRVARVRSQPKTPG
jgi:hypothetical protein